jgi:serine phosphatase RsbU (regulator of sigma subunit)
MVYGVLDAASGVWTFANAGHPSPLLVTGSARPQPLQTDEGRPLGIMESGFSEFHLELGRGDCVVLCSDGVTETTNSSGEEYGVARLDLVLDSVEPSAKALIEDVQMFAQSGELSDDATAVVVRRLPDV